MRKFILSLLALAPMVMYAQDNTWERPEEEQQEEVVKQKVNPDAKYLRGADPEVDGKVVFSTHIAAPGKTAAQVYDILHTYIQKMMKEKNQLENTRGPHPFLLCAQGRVQGRWCRRIDKSYPLSV